MRMSPSDDLEAGNMEPGWDSDLKSVSDPETEGPRMEIDWIRTYINKSSVEEYDNNRNRNKTKFY